MRIKPEDYFKAEENGINRRTLEMRIQKSGMDKQTAMTKPVNKDRSTWLPVAIKNGIKPKTFDYRYYVAGMKPEIAATTPVKSRRGKACI